MDWNILLFGKAQKFRINILPPSSGRKPAETGDILSFSSSYAGFLLDLLFDPEDGGDIFYAVPTTLRYRPEDSSENLRSKIR
jgi:hypothetical protein